MCAMGLPTVGTDNGRGRMIVYVGNTEDFDDPGAIIKYTEPPARIYPPSTLEKTIKAAGIQVNAIVPDMSDRGTVGFVQQLIKDTGGQHIECTEVAWRKPHPRQLDNLKDELSNAVDKIFAEIRRHRAGSVQQQATRCSGGTFRTSCCNSR